jgi:hypothetical protein
MPWYQAEECRARRWQPQPQAINQVLQAYRREVGTLPINDSSIHAC